MLICGRDFTPTDLDWIRRQVTSVPGLNRAQLSRMFCEWAEWRKPDGGLKDMSCRVALLRLYRAGVIPLPAPRKRRVVPKRIQHTLTGEPQSPIEIGPGRISLSIEPVDRRSSPLWNELIDRYHYLGYARMGGAQMRFMVWAGQHLVALLGFSAAAWRVAPRDEFIGWSDDQRKANLHRVIDNSRFLILPWVKSFNLASQILARTARMLPDWWEERYHYRPSLLETFVEKQRFTGASYKAANWVCVGQTQGRGKWDRQRACDKPVKTIWLYPLERRFREVLCR